MKDSEKVILGISSLVGFAVGILLVGIRIIHIMYAGMVVLVSFMIFISKKGRLAQLIPLFSAFALLIVILFYAGSGDLTFLRSLFYTDFGVISGAEQTNSVDIWRLILVSGISLSGIYTVGRTGYLKRGGKE